MQNIVIVIEIQCPSVSKHLCFIADKFLKFYALPSQKSPFYATLTFLTQFNSEENIIHVMLQDFNVSKSGALASNHWSKKSEMYISIIELILADCRRIQTIFQIYLISARTTKEVEKCYLETKMSNNASCIDY